MSKRIKIEEMLREYSSLRAAIDSLGKRIAALDDKSTALRAVRYDTVRVIGGESTAENSLVSNIDKRQQLEIRRIELKEEKEIIENGLSLLDSAERRIIDLFYIRRQTGHVEQLCEEMGIERTQVYREKEKAIEKLERYFEYIWDK